MATVLTTSAVAAALGCSVDKVRRCISKGAVPKPTARVGSWNVYSKADVAALRKVLKAEEKLKATTKRKKR